MALFARTLSAIEKDRRRSGKPDDDLGKKTTKELFEMAMQLPELREMFRERQ